MIFKQLLHWRKDLVLTGELLFHKWGESNLKQLHYTNQSKLYIFYNYIILHVSLICFINFEFNIMVFVHITSML